MVRFIGVMPEDIYSQNWHEAREAALKQGLRIVEHGWEQHVIIDEVKGIVYRYPRHSSAAAKLKDEIGVLDVIHRHQWPFHLPLLIEQNEIYSSYNYIPGTALTEAVVNRLDANAFLRIGVQLGEFLAQFHKLDQLIVEQKKTKHDTNLLEYYSERISDSTSEVFGRRARGALEGLMRMLQLQTPVVVHGDMQGSNVVIDTESGSVNGVIDFGEVEIGEPHQEFRKIFMTIPQSLDSAVRSYREHGGQELSQDIIIQWAFVNEWANICYFADKTENLTYKRALTNLKKWGQI